MKQEEDAGQSAGFCRSAKVRKKHGERNFRGTKQTVSNYEETEFSELVSKAQKRGKEVYAGGNMLANHPWWGGRKNASERSSGTRISTPDPGKKGKDLVSESRDPLLIPASRKV